jgi:hypothetical protein
MDKLHTAPCCSLILPSTIRSSKRFLQVVQLKSCTDIYCCRPCQYSTLFVLASSVIVFELAVAEYEVCVSIWRYEFAKMASECRGSVPSLLWPSVKRSGIRKRYRPTPFFISSFLILTSFYQLIVGVESYCYTWSHAVTHTHTYTHTHTHTYTHARARGRNPLDKGSAQPTYRSPVVVVPLCEMSVFQLFCKAYVRTWVTGSWTLWCLAVVFIPWQERK